MIRIIILICIALLMSACTATKAVIAMNKSTEHFLVYNQDERVLYEEGAESQAEIVANLIEDAIATIEYRQYREFTKPVKVYVCDSVESFTSYCVDQNAAGCVLNERLFLSPKNFIPNQDVLMHELSHLHIEQQLGMISWHSGYPSWFQEGLATYVSGGQGASKVTVDEAVNAINAGSMFKPDTSGGLIIRKTAYSYGLKSHMFYRQASMFVEYLHNLSERKFKRFLLSIEDGEDFEKAFSFDYGMPLNEMWKEFTKELSLTNSST